MTSRLRTLSLLAIGIACGVSMSFGYAAWAAHDSRVSVVPWQHAQMFAEVYEHIKQEYVDDTSDQQLMENAIRGAVASLDPYSAYLDAKEFEEMRMSTAGEYSGVGIEISLSENTLKVISTIEDSPAARADIRAGDVVIAIDKIPIDANNLNESVERLRGKSGSRVKLTISRDTAPMPFDVTLTRGSVQVHSVKQEMLEPGYGYVRISQFNENTGVDFSRALTTLQKQDMLRGLVLDLRNNPGGVLDAAVSVADALLDHGTIVTAEGRASDAKFAMQAHPGDLLNNAPVVILVNGGSASASEIVAGALKDNARALLVGRTTYGKGSVQSVLPLASGGALKLTTSRYHTPSGASIHQHGIVPDVVIDNVVKQAPPAPKNGNHLLIDDAEVRIALEKVKLRKS
ncbi:MAG TPA: S41 family peptidase [Steroidobacteraceae bacterium]|nr:S41 family peptidase [Steroidobacteraceae bacterium]